MTERVDPFQQQFAALNEARLRGDEVVTAAEQSANRWDDDRKMIKDTLVPELSYLTSELRKYRRRPSLRNIRWERLLTAAPAAVTYLGAAFLHYLVLRPLVWVRRHWRQILLAISLVLLLLVLWTGLFFLVTRWDEIVSTLTRLVRGVN
jgi:hypothetical protein